MTMCVAPLNGEGDVKTRNLHFTTLFENVYQYEIW